MGPFTFDVGTGQPDHGYGYYSRSLFHQPKLIFVVGLWVLAGAVFCSSLIATDLWLTLYSEPPELPGFPWLAELCAMGVAALTTYVGCAIFTFLGVRTTYRFIRLRSAKRRG